MKPYWISWTGKVGVFEWHGPWWVSGTSHVQRSGEDIAAAFSEANTRDNIVAAVMAESEEHAQALIRAAHDDGVGPKEWRFCEDRAPDWSPFCARFPRAEWMQ